MYDVVCEISGIIDRTSAGFSNRSDKNCAVKPQKIARGLEIKEVERLYSLCSENKKADQLKFSVTTQLICTFVFT